MGLLIYNDKENKWALQVGDEFTPAVKEQLTLFASELGTKPKFTFLICSLVTFVCYTAALGALYILFFQQMYMLGGAIVVLLIVPLPVYILQKCLYKKRIMGVINHFAQYLKKQCTIAVKTYEHGFSRINIVVDISRGSQHILLGSDGQLSSEQQRLAAERQNSTKDSIIYATNQVVPLRALAKHNKKTKSNKAEIPTDNYSPLMASNMDKNNKVDLFLDVIAG